MVNTKKKKSLRPPAKKLQSRRARGPALEMTAENTKVSKIGKSKKTRASAKGRTATSQTGTLSTELPTMSVGDKVPSEILGLNVLLDDGKKTSLGAQLEHSPSGGLIVFVYPKASDDDAYDYAMEFDYRQFNFESAEMSMIGLTPSSVSANATLKKDKEVYFPLLSDPKSKLINAIGFNMQKSSKKVGVFAMDKQGTVHAYCFGKKDDVLDRLDRDMAVLMD